MKKILFVLFIASQAMQANSFFWGKTGHRVVGEVASQYLTPKAKKEINKLLDGQSLALVANFADDIKSDKRFREVDPWHYVNMSLDKHYGEETVNDKGDIYTAIEKCLVVLRDDKASKDDCAFYLKLLVHFIGDLHQPLHVGRSEDKGGNDIQVQWFNSGTNLHAVWDSRMIDSFGMSYTEMKENMPVLSKKEVKAVQEGTVLDWMHESQALAKEVYGSAQIGEKLGYQYMYAYFNTANVQLQRGGIRLAKVLNELF